MLFLICIFLIAVICEFALYIISRLLQWKMEQKTLICSLLLMNMVSGIWTRMKFYEKWGGIYDFMAFGKVQIIRMLPTVFTVNAVLCVVIIVLHMLLSGKDRTSVIKINNYRILPMLSIKYFILITGSLYFVFSAADTIMPQFAYWSVENRNLLYMTSQHVETNWNQNKYGYPIVNANVLNETESEDTVILVIGDSFIWGDGTGNVNNLWWRALQRRIWDRGYNHCKVIAVGQCGASTQDELFWLSQTSMLEDINPDMIIIGYVTNDAQYLDENGIKKPGVWGPASHLEKGILKYVSRVFPNIAYKINNDLQSREIAMTDLSEQDLYSYSEWEYQIITGDNLIRYQKVAVEPLGEFLQKLSIPYCLMTTPNTPDYDSFYARYKDVLPLFGEAGIPVYDCLSDFSEKHGQDTEYYEGINPVNSHPGIATNAYLADYAMSMIENYYPDVLGKRGTQAANNVVLNDWMPFDQMNPSVEENTIRFRYSDDWEKNRYLYMPMFSPTVKICFENVLDIEGIVVRDADGNICEDFEIWVSCMNEQGYENFIKKKLPMDGNVYRCDYRSITSLNIHRISQGQGEKEYTIEIQ